MYLLQKLYKVYDHHALDAMRMLSKYFMHILSMLLKVPKCEIFHLFDLNDFYVIKSI